MSKNKQITQIVLLMSRITVRKQNMYLTHEIISVQKYGQYIKTICIHFLGVRNDMVSQCIQSLRHVVTYTCTSSGVRLKSYIWNIISWNVLR